MNTKGLKWEFGEEYNEMDKDFVSLSNIAIGNRVEISVEAGKVAVFISELIDKEMLAL